MTRSLQAKSFLAVAFAIALVILAVEPAAAQSTARIEGIVTDNSGAAVPGATVTATNLGTNATRIVVTDTNGAYTMSAFCSG